MDIVRTEAEKGFIDQYTRSLMVDWAKAHVAGDLRIGSEQEPYLSFAIGKGWVSKKEPYKVLSTGFTVAAAYLRR